MKFNATNLNLLSSEAPVGVLLFDESVTLFPAEAPVAPGMHSHDFIEICYVLEGSGFHRVNGQDYTVSRGDLFIINFEDEHLFYTKAAGSPLLTYNIMFLPSFIDDRILGFDGFDPLPSMQIIASCFSLNPGKVEMSMLPEEQLFIEQLMKRMNREYKEKQPGYVIALRGCLMELLVSLFRCMNRKDNHARHEVNRRIIEDILNELHAHFPEKPNLTELAHRTLVSRGYLCTLFKQKTGQTLSEYVQCMRIEEACRRIERSDDTLSTIAEDVGYTDYKAFFTVFKRITGHTPKSWLQLKRS